MKKQIKIEVAARTHSVTATCKLTKDIKVHVTGLSKYAAKKLKNTLKTNHPEYNVTSGID